MVRNAGVNINTKRCAQHIQTTQKSPIKIIYTFFMGRIPKPIVAYPLYGMENNDRKPKKEIKNK
mgnify:CR=1 FL=1